VAAPAIGAHQEGLKGFAKGAAAGGEQEHQLVALLFVLALP
jgi:hypothetical protein